MRNIAIYGKSISDFNLKFLNNLIKSLIIELNANIYIYHKLKNHKSILDHFDIKFFNSHDVISGKIDLLISFGGDGTLLDTVTMIKNSNIPVLGINAGRLGFLANINQDDILLAVKALKNRDYNLDELSLIHI